MTIVCPGVLATGTTGEALCVDELGAAVAWEPEPEFQIDFAQVGEPFGVGFLLMASCWALGKGVALVIDLVRR